jgi:hypothetical protein
VVEWAEWAGCVGGVDIVGGCVGGVGRVGGLRGWSVCAGLREEVAVGNTRPQIAWRWREYTNEGACGNAIEERVENILACMSGCACSSVSPG